MAKEDKFYRQVLPNGLKVIFEKRDIPIVVNMAATQFGSGHEPANVKGIAHLMEHSVFRKTKNRNYQDITSAIEKLGGHFNAFTGEEITAYFSKLRADHFEVGMDIIADVMLNPSFLKRDFDKEKKIIAQEIHMWHDSPTRHIQNKITEQLYAAPFGLSGLGTPQTLNNVSRAVLQKYHSIYYSPSNIVMVVVGKAEVDHIWNLARKYFLKKQVQRQIDKRQKLKIAEGPFGDYVEKRQGLDQAHVSFAYYQPTTKDRLRYAAEIMDEIYGALGFSSRLFQEVREKKNLAYNAYSDLNQDQNYAYGKVYLGTSKDKVAAAKKIALAELKKMQKVDAKAVDEAKEKLIGKYALRSESSESVAMDLLHEELNGDGKEYYKYIANISGVKLEDVREAAKVKKVASVTILPGD